jgi:hypothetical protein
VVVCASLFPTRSVIRTSELTVWTTSLGPAAIHGSGGSIAPSPADTLSDSLNTGNAPTDPSGSAGVGVMGAATLVVAGSLKGVGVEPRSSPRPLARSTASWRGASEPDWAPKRTGLRRVHSTAEPEGDEALATTGAQSDAERTATRERTMNRPIAARWWDAVIPATPRLVPPSRRGAPTESDLRRITAATPQS